MPSTHAQKKASKKAKSAIAHSQPIANMWARQAAAAAPNATENETTAEQNDAVNDNTTDGGGVVDGGDGDGGDGGDGGGDDDSDDEFFDAASSAGNERWPSSTKEWFTTVKNDIDAKVKMIGRGDQRRPTGKFPDKYKMIVSPSDDPLSFFDGETLTRDHFALPDLLVCYDEAKYPTLFPFGRPKCKWHNEYGCCVSKGWMSEPRRGYVNGRNCAILGRKYKCKKRQEEGEEHVFRNIDREVIDNSPDYVRLQWMKLGFDLSHRAGISNKDLQLCKRCLVEGLSISGFTSVMEQTAKHHHLILTGQWQSYTASVTPTITLSQEQILNMRRQPFYEFESDQYDQSLPSNAYVIERVVLLLEAGNDYKERRMQMVDGAHLSGDHSFKVVKCCSTRDKPFTAVYCVLNEFGQAMAFHLTTGTGMDELEEPLRKLKQRYDHHGFIGPESFTTDRCCQDRPFLNRTFGFNSEDEDFSHLHAGDTIERRVVCPPYSARCAYNTEIALALVGEISSFLDGKPNEQRVIVVDGEWSLQNKKMDLLIIGLLNGQVYLFHLAEICRRGAQFPISLKTLLEDQTVSKVGNRICADVKKLEGWDVGLSPVVELGHLAYDRCLVPTRAPSLASLIELLFPGVEIDGKEGSVRTSDWNRYPLTLEQIQYANADGYAPTRVYLRIMQFMNPRVEGKIVKRDADVGMKVLLYLPGLKSQVSEGIIRGPQPGRFVTVEIDLAKAECKSAMVEVVNDDDSIEESKSIQYLLSNLSEGDPSVVNIKWAIPNCRRRRDPVGEDARIVMNTVTKQIVPEDVGDEDDNDVLHTQNGGGDNLEDESGLSSDGEDDERTRLSRSLRRRLHQLRAERVKNDIVHIFLRFQRVLSKEHGAYFSFITSLRDAIFVLNDDDLEECFEVLREKRGMNDEEIAKMMAYNSKWFLRRVRRLVPDPTNLVKRYMAVFNAHKDIICQKSGKKLFATTDAIAQHHSALKHMKRNCISDRPFVNYYTPRGRDKYGLMRWRCHRSTSQNEGLHQHLRQLVRGFSNSPRFLCAIISEYLLQWNQKIDVKVRGLPSKYYGLYDGVLLEDVIEKLDKCVEEPPFSEWIPTSAVQSTGETFGVIRSNPSSSPSPDSEVDDALLTFMAEEAADALSDDEAAVGVVDADIEMPSSSQWMAKLTGKIRPFERVRSSDEWEYFQSEYINYHGRGSGGADNYSSINWSAFADSWNRMVDNLGHTKPSITYKSASHLQQAYRSMLKRRKIEATLRPHTQALDNLREEHTSAQTRAQYLPQFATPVTATTAQPFLEALETAEPDNTANYDGDLEEEVPQDNAATTTKPRRRRSRHRCRKCGKEYASKDWKSFHKMPSTARGLRNQDCSRVWDFCKVPIDKYEDGFPCLDGKMPKRKRKQGQKQSSKKQCT